MSALYGCFVILISGIWDYILTVLIAVDILANAILAGEAYTTISCRIGESIQAGGWASYVPWPAFLRGHFLRSVFVETV